MADEPKPDEKAEPEEQGKKKKSKRLLVIILGSVLLLGGGAAAAIFFLGGGDEDVAATIDPDDEPAKLVAMDTFLVNLNDPSGSRYMKVTMSLTVSPQMVADAVETDDLLRAKLRDRILTLLSARTFTELVSPLGKESLRRDIQVELDPMVEDGRVQNVLFSEFVVQ